MNLYLFTKTWILNLNVGKPSDVLQFFFFWTTRKFDTKKERGKNLFNNLYETIIGLLISRKSNFSSFCIFLRNVKKVRKKKIDRYIITYLNASRRNNTKEESRAERLCALILLSKGVWTIAGQKEEDRNPAGGLPRSGYIPMPWNDCENVKYLWRLAATVAPGFFFLQSRL